MSTTTRSGVTVIAKLTTKPKYYWATVIALLLLALLSSVWVVFVTTYPWYNIRSGSIACLLLFVTISFSVNRLDATFVYGVKVFGIPALNIKNGGLWIIIPGIVDLIREKKAIQQVEFPGEPENIFQGEEGDFEAAEAAARTLGKQLVRPIRIMTGAGSTTSSTTAGSEGGIDPLDRRLQPKVRGTVSFSVDDPLAFEINAGGVGEAVRRLRDTWESTTASEFGEKSPNEIVKDLKSIREALRATIEDLTKNWGIKIIEVNLAAPDFGKTIGAATASQGAAIAAADATRTAASAEKFKIKEVGEATADAATKLAKAVKDSPELVAIEVAKSYSQGLTGFKGGTLVLGSPGGQNPPLILNTGGSTPNHAPANADTKTNQSTNT